MSMEKSKKSFLSLINREQRKAFGLLSIGTFLQCFDIMLYIHMAVLLNEIFFPATDPFTASLLSAFSFCSTYLLAPFGALIFGYIGDYFGRKVVVIMATFLMGISCIVIAILPTYAQIGIMASWILTACRIIQGMASAAETRGAEIYLTESIQPPIQYPLVALLTAFSAVGTMVALGIGSIFTNTHIFYDNESSWRIAFLVGAAVALVGAIGRTSLRESEEFTNKKNKVKNNFSSNQIELNDTNLRIIDQQPTTLTSISYFLIQCARPPCFYFIYIYCGDLLKQECNFNANQVINQNFLVSIIDLFGLVVLAYLSYKVPPLKILKVKLFLFFSALIFFPIVLTDNMNSTNIFIFQSLAALFVFDHVPAAPIFYKYFSVLKRFTYTSFLGALAELLTYLITSFSLVYTTALFGYWGLFFIFVPAGLGFFISVSYFQKLESQIFYSKL